MKRVALALAVLPFCGGCGNPAFSDANDDQTVEVMVGSPFTVTTREKGDPMIEGTIIRFDGKQAEADGRQTLRFTALGRGETVIRAGGFVLRVKVKSAADEPKMRVHNN